MSWRGTADPRGSKQGAAAYQGQLGVEQHVAEEVAPWEGDDGQP